MNRRQRANDDLPRYKAVKDNALYRDRMETTGDLRVSDRGQMSLPSAARHRWNLADGGRVGYLDLGDAIVIVPQGTGALRRQLLAAIDDETWLEAAAGFGDVDLASS